MEASTPHCSARTRSGTACRLPPVSGKKRCRFHGGLSTGAPKGNQNALKHGMFTAEAVRSRRELRAILKEASSFLDAF